MQQVGKGFGRRGRKMVRGSVGSMRPLWLRVNMGWRVNMKL